MCDLTIVDLSRDIARRFDMGDIPLTQKHSFF